LTAVNRMTTLIDDLLTYSRSTSGTDSFSDVDFNVIVAEITSAHREELEQKNATVEVGKLPRIKAINFQCKQLMDNLINNAIKFLRPDRARKISIDSTLVKASDVEGLPTKSDKPYVQISIADN